MEREHVTLICPVCHEFFNVLEDEAIPNMKCYPCECKEENTGGSNNGHKSCNI